MSVDLRSIHDTVSSNASQVSRSSLPRRVFAGLLHLVFVLTSTIAASAQTQESDPGSFEAITLDGSRNTGRVDGFELRADGSGLFVVAGERTISLPVTELFKLARTPGDSTAVNPGATALVLLPEGDRVYAPLTSADQATLSLGPGAISDIPVNVPLEYVLGFVLAPSSSLADTRTRVRQIRDPKREGETIWLDNGDAQAGLLVSLDANEARLDGGNAVSNFQRSRVVAVGYDQSLVGYPPAKSAFLEVGLSNGSRIGLLSAALRDGLLVGEARCGVPVRINWRNVTYLQILNGRAQLLGSRTPAATQFVPYLDHHPDAIGVDSTWDGRPIRVGGRKTEHGLGMLPRTLAAYRVEPTDRRFQATIGLDDSAGEMASVVFRVLVDRKEAFASPPMTKNDAPVFVDIDLQKGKLLVLVAEFGERGDVHDSAIWADARIITAPVSP